MTHKDLRLILGPPGTGKTTRALSIMEQELAAGTDPRRIGYVSFTKKATSVAKARAIKQFNFTDDQLPWVRTIHSLVFKCMGYRRDQVFGRKHCEELSKILGREIAGSVYSEEGVGTLGVGDRLIFLDNIARVTRKGLRSVWENDDHDIAWAEADMFSRAYKRFKERRGLVDYTDMLEHFCSGKIAPILDVLIVDETQDCSRLQFDALQLLANKCRVVYVAADDDQCIHTWCGADLETFLKLKGTVEILDQSYRISPESHALATSLISRVHNRLPKDFKPRAGGTGKVPWISSPDQVDLGGDQSWLLLARTSWMLPALEQICMDQGVNFDSPGRGDRKSKLLRAIMLWESLRRGEAATVEEVLSIATLLGKNLGGKSALKAADPATMLKLDDLKQGFGLRTDAIWHESLLEFPQDYLDRFLRARMNKEKLLKEARVKVSTIHGVKGGQADNVLLMTDTSWSASKEMERNPDSETRVFYVGVTRAFNDLVLVQPQTNLYFDL